MNEIQVEQSDCTAMDTAFEIWWHNEGSGMPPMSGEDAETHVRRICKIAWENGAYKVRNQVFDLRMEVSRRIGRKRSGDLERVLSRLDTILRPTAEVTGWPVPIRQTEPL